MNIERVIKNVVWIFVLIVMEAIAEECLIPAICNNQLSWTRLSQNCETNLKNEINEIQQNVADLKDEIKFLRGNVSQLTNELVTHEIKQVASTQYVNSSISKSIEASTGFPGTTNDITAFEDTVSTESHITSPNTPVDEITTHKSTTDEVTTSVVAQTTIKGNCELTYNSTSFTAIMDNVNYNEAETLCNETNGKPANIYDVAHYTAVLKCLRENIPDGWTKSEVWTGMRYEDKQLKLRSGENSSISAEVWWRDYPDYNAPGHNSIVFTARMDMDDEYQGLVNVLPSANYHGVICEN